jgi:predicted kinase
VEEVTQIVKCLRGLPGSGKSTYAKRLLTNPDWVRVNRDDLRASVFGGAGVLSHTEENLITKMQRDIAAHALQSGLNVVVDDTNLRNKYLREWNKFALQHGAFFDVHDIDTPWTCVCPRTVPGTGRWARTSSGRWLPSSPRRAGSWTTRTSEPTWWRRSSPT